MQDTLGDSSFTISGAMKVLVGDANGDGAVNSADTTIVRNGSGQSVNASNYRADSNLDGVVDSANATMARALSGSGLPPASVCLQTPSH